MELIIDTNAYSAMARGDEHIKSVLRRATRVHLTFVTLAELRAGFACGKKGIANEKILQQTLAVERVSVMYPDAATTLFYARIFADLRQRGTPIPTNDLWIAALAMQNGLPLLTRDKHFQSVQSITCVS